MSHQMPRANLRFAIHFRSVAAAINQLSFVSDIRKYWARDLRFQFKWVLARCRATVGQVILLGLDGAKLEREGRGAIAEQKFFELI